MSWLLFPFFAMTKKFLHFHLLTPHTADMHLLVPQGGCCWLWPNGARRVHWCCSLCSSEDKRHHTRPLHSERRCLTSPTALDRMWTIFSWGVATTLWLLISMMRWPTLTPPRSAIPPRIRLQICAKWKNRLVSASLFFSLPSVFHSEPECKTHNAVLDTEAQLVAEVGPSDEHCGDWRTSDDVEFDPRLVL